MRRAVDQSETYLEVSEYERQGVGKSLGEGVSRLGLGPNRIICVVGRLTVCKCEYMSVPYAADSSLKTKRNAETS